MAFQEEFNPFGGINKSSGNGGSEGGGGGAGGGGVMVVTINGSNLSCSYNDLLEALTAGKHIDLHVYDEEDVDITIYILTSLNVIEEEDPEYADEYTAYFTNKDSHKRFVSFDATAQMQAGIS